MALAVIRKSSSAGSHTGTVNTRRRLLRSLSLVFVLSWIATAWWNVSKPLPPGMHVDGQLQPVPAQDLRLLFDVTAANARGEQIRSQQIFDAVLALIAGSRDFLLLDYFLFNGQGGPASELNYANGLRPLAQQLRQALLARRRAAPDMPILLIVDPINGYYERALPPELAQLRAAGITVIVTDLDPLRDSNPSYSALWRLTLRWWLDPAAVGWIRNLLDAGGPKLSAGALARLLNFKANHRKVIITGDGQGSLRGSVMSANPHDASSAHSNVGLRFSGPALRPLLQSELAIARFSGWSGELPSLKPGAAISRDAAQTSRVAVVTEGAIRDRLVERLDACTASNRIDIAMFYLADRAVARSLIAAARRGAVVRLILDPNKDAFGFEKSGLPNRPVAAELLSASNGAIRIRWYRTHGEQFHSKIAAISGSGRLWLMLGSANFTRRNLGDYNLEANVIVDAAQDGELARDFHQWFETLWSNRAAEPIDYTVDFSVYADPSRSRYWLYRLMEGTGLSTF